MSNNPWLVQPDVVTVNLAWKDPEGVERPFWIKIKKFLTVGEERVVRTAGWRGVTGIGEAGAGDAEIRIDWKATSFAQTQAYLIDWSLEDEKHNRVPLAAMQNLHPEVYELIEQAVTDHVRAMESEKKARSSSSEPTPTSA